MSEETIRGPKSDASADKIDLQHLDHELRSKQDEMETLQAKRTALAQTLQGMARTQQERTNGLLLGAFLVLVGLGLSVLGALSSPFRFWLAAGILCLFIGIWILIKTPKTLVSDSQIDPRQLDRLRSQIEILYHEIRTLKQRKAESEAASDPGPDANGSG